MRELRQKNIKEGIMIYSIQCFLSSLKFRIMIFLGGIFIILFCTTRISYAQTQNGIFKYDGLTRSYIVFLPQNYQPNMPVVFNLHAYGRTAQWHVEYSRMNAVADTSGFIVVYPDAIYPGFNTGLVADGYQPLPTHVDDVGFISALIDTMKAHFDIDMKRIYCCGKSNGGFMTYRLAGELSHRFAAMASVAGTFSNNFSATWKPVRSFPILHIHGTGDAIIKWNGSSNMNAWTVDETINYWIQNNNCVLNPDTVLLPNSDPNDGCTVEKISYSNCDENTKVILYKVINGGHSWPDSEPSVTPSSDGNVNRDINANVEIWNFLKNYQNPLTTDIEVEKSDSNELPGNFELFQNYPNPFNTETTIQYQLPELLKVKLVIYNLLGQRIAILKDEEQSAGIYSVQWDGKDDTGKQLPGGVYLYRLETMEFSKVKQLTLLR